MTNLISAKNLAQGYGASTVLEGLDFDVQPGVTGLLGPNGAGKSTLLRTLATVVAPRSGTLELHGRDASDPRQLEGIRRGIGFLPQTFGYPKNFSVVEFVQYSAWLRGVPSETRAEATRAAIEAVDLMDASNKKMSKLSGGMRQRAGIAATIVGDPAVVILDEPTVGLDPMQRIAFRDIIKGVPERYEACVVLSTHLVEDIGACCDHVAVMNNGRITWSGAVVDFEAAADAGAPGATDLERAYATALHRVEVSK